MDVFWLNHFIHLQSVMVVELCVLVFNCCSLLLAAWYQHDEETRSLSGKVKEEPDGLEVKQEPMEVDDKKPDIKGEPKEEEEGGTNGSATSAFPSQPRRKSKTMSMLGICSIPACLCFACI